jgi:hypothetical protein
VWGIESMVFIILLIMSLILAVVTFKDMLCSTANQTEISIPLSVTLDGESEKLWYYVRATQQRLWQTRAGISFSYGRGLMDMYYSLFETCQD